MFDRPQIPVVHHGAGQQYADTTGQRTQHGEPPGPTVDGFHGGVKAHGPTPKQSSTFRCGTAVNDLLNLALAAVTRHGQDGRAVHRKQQHRAIQEHNRQSVERVVEQVAVANGQSRRPVQVREDAVRHGFAP